MACDELKFMSSKMKVEIQSKKWIKPATPTPSHLHKLNLSSIDQLVPPMFVQLIFHFDIGKETKAQTTPDQRLSLLEKSLSKVLTLYYPFAGRYDEDESMVSCQDQGVEFVVASVDRKLDKLIIGECDNLVSNPQMPSTSGFVWSPVVSIQVNVFTCGGVAIGLSFFHKVGDMFTISMFMNAWATVCHLGTLDRVVRPIFNPSSLLPLKDYLKPSKSSSSSETNPPPLEANMHRPKFVVKRFIFTGEAISRLKSSTDYTRVELVTALITKTLINLIEYSKLIRPNLVINHIMNLRSRLPLLPLELGNSCGNLGVPVMATLDLVKNESWGLQELAGLVRDSIRNVAVEMRKVRDWSELSEKLEKSQVKFSEELNRGEKVNLVMFSSWFKFGLNEVDFGWGRPSLVSTVSGPDVFICLMDCNSDAGGIEAWVNLEEDDMARFQQEPDILAYTSS